METGSRTGVWLCALCVGKCGCISDILLISSGYHVHCVRYNFLCQSLGDILCVLQVAEGMTMLATGLRSRSRRKVLLLHNIATPFSILSLFSTTSSPLSQPLPLPLPYTRSHRSPPTPYCVPRGTIQCTPPLNSKSCKW